MHGIASCKLNTTKSTVLLNMSVISLGKFSICSLVLVSFKSFGIICFNFLQHFHCFKFMDILTTHFIKQSIPQFLSFIMMCVAVAFLFNYFFLSWAFPIKNAHSLITLVIFHT